MNTFLRKIGPEKISRRKFLYAGTLTATGVIAGCAVNPVTGKNQLMLLSQSDEIQIDRTNSPHQFSADYGPSQDTVLNRYLDETGRNLAILTHRRDMPYSFRAVNATYVNAYAFPGGSIAATRGILLGMESEAELAGLIGHELGHVNARHTASAMSKNLMTQALVAGVVGYVAYENEKYAGLAAGLGMLGTGLLLARYSRDNERQADSLGIEYMVNAGYSPQGFIDLMDLLRSLSDHKPNAIELMFATHPMSQERYRTAVETVRTSYPVRDKKRLFRERYMDHTAGLRRMKPAIELMQKGESAIAKENFRDAESQLSAALNLAPRDYAGLMMMAKCELAQTKFSKAREYCDRAREVYPEEAQSYHVLGLTELYTQDYQNAFTNFDRYEKMLPGNSGTIFFKGLAQEQMQHKEQAAKEFNRYLQSVNQGEQAEYAYQRLVDWGYIKKEEQPSQ